MNEGLRRAVQEVLPKVKLVVDPFHVIADANKRLDEARRIEQEALRRKRVTIPKKIFLVGNERLSDQKRERVKGLLIKYPSLQGFYWAKEKLRELYRQGDQNEAARLLDNIIFNLKSSDDGELIRWGNTLRRWKEPILNHFENQTTNGFTEGCNIKMLKRISYGLRNVDVYAKKLLLAFLPPTIIYYHKI
jgi:transposase